MPALRRAIFSKMMLLAALAVFSAGTLFGAGGAGETASAGLHDALPEAKWRQIDQAVDRGLAWIATQQQADGSIGVDEMGGSAQPALTSLSIMAFLSRGHLPGYGPYGETLNRAIDFVISCQMSDGLFSHLEPEPTHLATRASGTATYNHAISGLMLGEVYGHVTGQRMVAVKLALERALGFTHTLQTREKVHPEDVGGWRYLRLQFSGGGGGGDPADSDMSVTAWQLMFLRSARNAEFNVPQTYINDAMEYVHRSFDSSQGIFYYVMSGRQVGQWSRGLVGAGIVSLSLAGEHLTPMGLRAGDWLVAHPFRSFGELVGGNARGGRGGLDRFYYSTYYCSQAAAQLGGQYWAAIFPGMAQLFLDNQNPDGSWPIGARGGGGFSGLGGGGGGRGGGNGEAWIGPVYPTAMSVLSLTPGYQLLPVYQR